MEQQQQTLDYFRRNADAWQRLAAGGEAYNVIAARNAAAISTMQQLAKPCRLLDVGCGTGQLVIAAAALGADARGIDFAPEMIAACRTNAAADNVSAAFECRSFFDPAPLGEPYQLIAAMGFIEYISAAELTEFFRRSAAMLSRGGALVVGSRNRLFNAVSMNGFTAIEQRLGVLDRLVTEAVALGAAATQRQAIEALHGLARIDPQPAAHPDTGIQVTTRHQFSPAELVGRLRAAGLATATLYPIHFHAVPPAMKTEFRSVHDGVANIMQQTAPLDHRAIPFCSSFVIDARKE